MKAEWTNKDVLTQSETTGKSKAMLVIGMPRDCGDCPCIHDEMWTCQADKEYREGEYSGRPAWCPLKPMPKERELKSTEYLEHYRLGHTGTYEREAYSIGWNDCLKEIEE